MKHLDDDNLLRYAFGLLEPTQHDSAATHLEQCPDCRAQLERMQQQFAALDALPAEERLPEDLLRKTTAAKPQPAAATPFYRKAWVDWMAAAAAVLLIWVLLLQQLPDTKVTRPKPAERKDVFVTQQDAAVRDRPRPPAAPALQDNTPEMPAALTAAAANGADAAIIPADSIPDTPPFAPASAIELVVRPKPDRTQLTIYNAVDLTLVRDTRKLTLKPGWNWLQFMWDGTLIDPTSLSLTPLAHADKIDIQQLVYPARLKDIGRWLIRSEVEGAVPFEITYFASGLSWRAFYRGTLNADETEMNLQGYVNVANHSGQDFENAQARLVIGEVHLLDRIPDLARRRYPYGPEIMDEEGSVTRYNWYGRDDKVPILGDIPTIGSLFMNGDRSSGFGGGAYFAIKDIEKEALSEYFLYTIEGTEDLPDAWAKRLPSFDVNEIPVKSLYKYDEDRYGTDTVRFVSFVNDTEHELGATPIPEGSVQLYRNLNAQQNLSYIGAANIKYIPVNQDVELNLGAARLVTVEPTLMETKTANYIFDANDNITGWDTLETWQIKLTNTRDIPVDLEITRHFGTDYWDIDTSGAAVAEYKKHDKTRARFTLTLPGRTEQSFTYTVTKYMGRRSEAYTRQLQEQKK